MGDELTALEMPKLQVIKGNFVSSNTPNLITIILASLESILGEFQLQSCRSLSTLSVPNLTSCGKIKWMTLELQTFTAQITKADELVVSDTKLTSLTGIDPATVKFMDINNNQYLKSVTMNLKNVSQALSMAFNSKNIQISFPQLVWSMNMTLTGAGSIDLPKLQHINGSMNIGNTTVQSISCKKLEGIEQTLAFIGNSAVTEMEFPLLKEIGGAFKIHNNSKMNDITGFPKLEQVRGAIDFVGNFDK